MRFITSLILGSRLKGIKFTFEDKTFTWYVLTLSHNRNKEMQDSVDTHRSYYDDFVSGDGEKGLVVSLIKPDRLCKLGTLDGITRCRN